MFIYVCKRSGFNPQSRQSWLRIPSLRVAKMSSNQYVDGWPLQKTEEVKRAAVRRPRVAYATSSAHYHMWFPYGLRGRPGSDAGWPFKALYKCSSLTFNFLQHPKELLEDAKPLYLLPSGQPLETAYLNLVNSMFVSREFSSIKDKSTKLQCM